MEQSVENKAKRNATFNLQIATKTYPHRSGSGKVLVPNITGTIESKSLESTKQESCKAKNLSEGRDKSKN